MKQPKQIQDPNGLYSLLRPTVDGLFRLSTRRYRLIGRENIPADGQIIYAPNHQNALLDALAVLSIDEKPKVFVSRADIHRNPRFKSILRWLKIMPINRMRDGIDNVRHNDVTIEQAVRVLNDGVPFCIMPEGTHRQKHSLLPLQKGIFRIALKAVSSSKPLYIVPVGLEYGDWAHIWSSLTVCIGQPICVNEYLQQHPELTEPQLILGLRQELTERMQQLILYVPDDEHYEANWAALDAHRPAPWTQSKSSLSAISLTALALAAPLFIACAIASFPIWLPLCFVLPKIKDEAFRGSVEFVVTWLWALLSLGLILLPWFFCQEYLYQFRSLLANHES